MNCKVVGFASSFRCKLESGLTDRSFDGREFSHAMGLIALQADAVSSFEYGGQFDRASLIWAKRVDNC